MKLSKIKSINKKEYSGLVYDLSFIKNNLFFSSSKTLDLCHKSLNNSVLVHNSPPDLDLDFMADTDHITDEFLEKKYGKERVLSVTTFPKFNEKGCLKDVVRAHRGQEETGFSSAVHQVTKEMPEFFDKFKFPPNTHNKLQWWFENWPKDPKCGDIVREFLTDPNNKQILEQTVRLQGQIKGIGQHPAGIVITPSASWNHIPTNIIAKNKSVVTAFQEADGSGKDLSELGILKLDRLKLETVNVIMDCIKMIKERHGKDIKRDLDFIDIHNQDLYEELRLGMNYGIFQFESSGMNALIRGIRIENMEELTAANALYRPGPMGIKAHEEFIRNKFNKNEIKYIHQALEPILKETNGVMIYQEQLMFIADKIGGMGLGAGDSLRRYMDKASDIIAKESSGQELSEKDLKDKNYQGFRKYWDRFLEGAEKNGYNKEEIDKLKGWIINYLGYSFNKCLTKNHTVESKSRGTIGLLDVEVGEEILGYNPETKMDEFNPVKKIHYNGLKKIYQAKTSSNRVLECTLDHKILTGSGMKTLLDANGGKVWCGVNENIDIVTYLGNQMSYDLEIDSPHHNYYANGVCVSNSHSLSYSYLALQTLYLKRYYPLEFYCALLNHPKQSGKQEEKIRRITASIYSAVSKGIKIVPPSMDSDQKWKITGDNEISVGLESINGFGDAAYAELMELQKSKNKPLNKFTKEEFFSHSFSKFNKSAFEACVKAGMFDKFSKSRGYLLELKEKKLKGKETKDKKQLSMWDLSSFSVMPNVDEKDFDPTDDSRKKMEFIEVCNFDLDEIERVFNIKKSVEEKFGFIDNILNFEEDGMYYFVVKDFQVHKSKKGDSIYLRINIGDGLSSEFINMFDPLASKFANKFKRGGVYVAEFVKNAKGFMNFKPRGEIREL